LVWSYKEWDVFSCIEVSDDLTVDAL
jgi:hypothetical protein